VNAEKWSWVISILGFVIGLFGVVDYLIYGHVHTAYGSYIPWGLWVASYVYFIGLSAGAFLLSTLAYVFGLKKFEPIGKLSLLAALACLLASMLSIWGDLGHPERAWRLILRTNFFSAMGWMAWFYSSYFLVLVLELWLAIRLEKRPNDFLLGFSLPKLLRFFGILGIPLAIAFHGGVGALFGVVGARPYWHTGLLPILFLVGALLSGGALLTLITVLFGRSWAIPNYDELVLLLGRFVRWLLAMDILLEWSEYSITWYAAIPAHVESLKLILFGPYWWVFWIVHLVFGIMIPLFIFVFWGQSPKAIGSAAFLIAATFLSVRLNIVIPGLAVPELKGLEQAYIHPRLSFQYFPTWTEWLVELAITCLAVVIFLAAYRILPIVRWKGAKLHGT
jgi:molybdopterin-containing oxidoreductase family membrane subunit